jgi:hypothetical protein
MSRDWKLCFWGLFAAWFGMALGDGHLVVASLLFCASVGMRIWAGAPPGE